MIELRWLKTSLHKVKLQYRLKTKRQLPFDRVTWGPWRDVPIILEGDEDEDKSP